jgi:hypothetical protein
VPIESNINWIDCGLQYTASRKTYADPDASTNDVKTSTHNDFETL